MNAHYLGSSESTLPQCITSSCIQGRHCCQFLDSTCTHMHVHACLCANMSRSQCEYTHICKHAHLNASANMFTFTMCIYRCTYVSARTYVNVSSNPKINMLAKCHILCNLLEIPNKIPNPKLLNHSRKESYKYLLGINEY